MSPDVRALVCIYHHTEFTVFKQNDTDVLPTSDKTDCFNTVYGRAALFSSWLLWSFKSICHTTKKLLEM